MADDVDEVVVDLGLGLDFSEVGKDEVVAQVALGSVDHEGFVLGQLELDFALALVRKVAGDWVVEQVAPFDPSLDVCSQHAPQHVLELLAHLDLCGQRERFGADQLDEVDHVGGDVGRSEWLWSYLP